MDNFWVVASTAQNVFCNEFVQQLLKLFGRMLAFHDGELLLIGSDFYAEVLNDGLIWNTKRICDVNQVCNISFDSVQSTFLLAFQRGHVIPKKRVRGGKRKGGCSVRHLIYYQQSSRAARRPVSAVPIKLSSFSLPGSQTYR